jgi:cell division protein FtsB
MCYRPLIEENVRMRREIMKKEGEIKEQQRISMNLSNQIYTLTNDPKTVERLAREKLGFARPDETVIHFEPATNSSTAR